MIGNDFVVWIIMNGFLAFSIFLIIKKREFFTNNKKLVLAITLTLILTSQYFRYFEGLLWGAGDAKELLGFLHYPCHVGTVFAIAYLIKQNKWTRPLAFAFSVGGLVSIVAPGGNPFLYGNTDFTYAIDHMILAILPVFVVVIDGYIPTWKTVRNYTIASVLIVYAFIPFVYADEERAKLNEFTNSTFEVDISSWVEEMGNPTVELMINEKELDESEVGTLICDEDFICIYTANAKLEDKSNVKLMIHIFDERKELTVDVELKENNVEDFYYVNEQILWSDLVPNASVWVWPFAYGLSAFAFITIYYLPLNYYVKKNKIK